MTTSTLTLAEPVMWGAPIVALIFVIVVLVQLKSGLNRLLKTRDLEEQEFQQTAEAMARLAANDKAPPAAAERTRLEAARPTGEGSPGTGDPVDHMVKQMMGLGLLEEKQGALPLAMEPPGVIYRLRGGGSCAILPRLECEEVMRHLCRRFEMVVVAEAGRDALVVQRFQQRVPSMLTLPRVGG